MEAYPTVLLLVIRRRRGSVAARGGAGATAEQVPPEEAGRPRVRRRLGELAPEVLLFLFLLGRRRGMVDAFGAASRVLSLKLANAARFLLIKL